MAFRTKKQLALLVYLYLEARSRGISRDSLAELLWPEVLPDKGRHSLSQACTAIRERLGPGALEGRGERLRLVAPLASDVDLLNSAAGQPLDLSSPLKDLDRAAGVELAHWVERARVGVARQARNALVEAVKHARARGDLPAAYRAAHVLLPIDPTCALAAQVVAERTLLDGDTIGAMRILREYVTRAERDVGGNPHPEITRLLHRLEQGSGPPLLGAAAQARPAPTRREVFVGREREMAELEALWSQSRETQYQACLITGPAGIGKSSLLRRFAATVAARAGPVFLVACQEIGQGIPFAAVSDLIRALARDPGSSGTDPKWLAEASRVSPGLRATYPGIPEPPEAPADSVRLRVAEALHRTLEAVAEGTPVLLAFDDMQHMDHASLDVLFLLTRRLDSVHVLLAGTERRDEGRPARPMNGDTRSKSLGWSHGVELEPLVTDQARALLTGLAESAGAVADPIRDKIVSLGQGNPYHIEILLADFRQHAAGSLVAADDAQGAPAPDWRPPETMRIAFARHYEGLSADAQHLLQVMAVAGRAMEIAEITGMFGLEGAAADRPVLEIVESGVIRVEGGRVYFKNDLHRAYVYWAMTGDARKYHHGRLGSAFAASGSRGDFQRLLEGAHHFTRAGMRKDAIEAAIAGADVAVARGAIRDAKKSLIGLIQAYPDLKDYLPVSLLLARTYTADGQYQAALDILQQMDPKRLNTSDRALAGVLKAEALHRGRLGPDEMIRRASAEAVELAERVQVDSVLVRALQVAAEVAADNGELERMKQAGVLAESLERSTADGECRALAALTRGFSRLVLGHLDQAAESFTESAAKLSALSLQVEYRRALNGLGISLTGLARYEEAVEALQRAVSISRQLGDAAACSNTLGNLASLYQDLGWFEAAAECYRSAFELQAQSTTRVTTELYADAARLALTLGNRHEAADFTAVCEASAQRSGLWRHIALSLLTTADFHIAEGADELAWPLVQEAVDLSKERSDLLADVGQFVRLQKHFLWKTQGPEAAMYLTVQGGRRGGYERHSDNLEIMAFDEWLARSTGRIPANAESLALRMIVSKGLIGLIARLITAGALFPPLERALPGESSAQLVARAFPHARRDRVPFSVSVDGPPPGGESTSSA